MVYLCRESNLPLSLYRSSSVPILVARIKPLNSWLQDYPLSKTQIAKAKQTVQSKTLQLVHRNRIKSSHSTILLY